MYQRPTSPLSIGGVLDDGFTLLKASFTRILPLAFLPAFLNQIPNVITGVDPNAPPTEMPPEATALTLVAAIVSLWFFGAIIARLDAITRGDDTGLGGALGVGGKRFLPMLGCSLLLLLCIMGGFIALIIPGLILMLSLAFAPYLVVTDNSVPIAALKKSHKLVWGNWWRTAAIFTVVAFISLVLYTLIGFVAALVGALFSSDLVLMTNIILLVVVPLMSALVSPVLYALSIALLNDLRLRSEGSDLAERMEGLEAG